jgi:phosphoribosylformylglycinamidine cyclo-ligase
MVHCSGGAQTKVMHFAEKVHIIKDSMFPVPPLFRLIQEESGTPWKEMYRVFNMGHRFEIYTDEATASQIIQISGEYNIEARIVGRCEESAHKKLTIKGEQGEFVY